MSKFPVLNIEGKEAGSIDLPDKIFGEPVNADVLHQAVVMYQACLRQGTADTKDRSEVSGGGKKPWRQKGTGRARHGSIRSPLWVKGGVIFGPHPRDFSYSIPKKIKKAALRESLNAKFQDKNLLCVDDIKKAPGKTKEMAKLLKTLNIKEKTLVMFDGSDPNVERVSRNIAYLNLVPSREANAYDILKHKKILVTKTAFKKLLERIK